MINLGYLGAIQNHYAVKLQDLAGFVKMTIVMQKLRKTKTLEVKQNAMQHN